LRANRIMAEPRQDRVSRDSAPAGPRVAVSPVRSKAPRARRRRVPLVVAILFGALILVNLTGLEYYLLTAAGRARSPLHPWFRSTGIVGQSAGIAAFLLFLFLWLYPIRKRMSWLASAGSLTRWLDVHIVVGLVVPIVGAIHAGWRFRGLIGLGYLLMLLVSLSGIVGRYLYVRIPRGRSGLQLTLGEVKARRRELISRIAAATGLDPVGVERAIQSAVGRRGGATPVLVRFLSSDLARFRAARSLRRQWGGIGNGRALDRATLREAVALARREIGLAQQARMLDATQRLFRFWHVAHLPIALTGLGAVLVHVVISIYLGVTWFW
jgi:hypothetical protein